MTGEALIEFEVTYMLLIAFVIANIITVLILLKKGYSLNTLFKMMLDGVLECKSVFIIILLMGATISVWLSSGIVPSLIYYGFNYMKGVNFVLAAFLGTMLISFVMGTACGTLSTIGIALLGIGAGLRIPVPILLGAIVSGSFIADKVAPISSLSNLTIQMTGVSYWDYLKSSILTLIPTVLLSAAIYIFLGTKYAGGVDTEIISQYQGYISQAFIITPYFLLFPLLVIILAFAGLNIVYNMSVGVAAASLITVFVQKKKFIYLIKSILWGYNAQTGMVSLDTLISGGGAIPMIEVVLIVMGSVTLSSLLEGAHLLKPLTEVIYKENDGKFKLIAKTGLLSIAFMAITCDQTVGILIPARFAGDRFDKIGLKRSVLARTISDTGTIVAPLLPWNVNSLIIYGITGISALTYGPYAVLCFINPIITILSGAINFEKAESRKLKVES